MSKDKNNQHRPRNGGNSGNSSGPTDPTPPASTGETVNVEARVVPESEAAANPDNVTPLFKAGKTEPKTLAEAQEELLRKSGQIFDETMKEIRQINKEADEAIRMANDEIRKIDEGTAKSKSKAWYQNDAVKITATTLGFGLAIGFLVTLASGAGTAVNRKMNG